MSKDKPTEPFEPQTHPAESFVPVRMLRSQIDGAPYNPRVHTAKAKARIKKGIKKLGLLEPVVWNRRTEAKGWPAGSRGCLVGGHMRLGIMDDLADGAPDYYLTVAAVDLTAAEERAGNVLLNNRAAAGDDDIDKLGEIYRFPDIDIEATGYEVAEVFSIFGDSVFVDNPNLDATGAELEATGQRIRELRDEIKARIAKKIETKNNDQFYIVLVFRDANASTKTLGRLGLLDPDDPEDIGARIQDGRLLDELADLRERAA